MSVIPSGYSQVNLKFTGDGLPTGAEVTFGIRNLDNKAAADIAGDVSTNWDTWLKALTPTHVTLSSILVKNGPNATGPAAEIAVGTVGTGGSAHVSPQVAVLVQKRTTLGGRMNRGRLYYPVSESEIDNAGALSSSFLAFATTNWAGFQADQEDVSEPIYILHNAGTDAPVGPADLVVQPVAATQRRRLRR
jgi:hypothetical protein